MFKRFVSHKLAVIVSAVVIAVVSGIAIAQPVIPAMKLRFYDNYLKIVYDSNPNTVGDTKILDVDGNDAMVTIAGGLNVSGGYDATYTQSFVPGEIAAVPSAFLTIAGLVYSASAQQLDMLYLTNGQKFIIAQSTAQTILPVWDSVGLDLGGDQVDGEAYEMFAGILGATGRPFVIGVDPAFYFCAAMTPVDASGVEDFTVGFRDANVTQTATLGSYLNYAVIGIEGSSGTTNPVPIYVTTGNDGSDTATDTTDTWADGINKRMCVFVSAAGVVTYTNDGAAPTTTAAFTFDDGDSVIPFVRAEQAADLAGAIDLTEWSVGFQSAGVNP